METAASRSSNTILSYRNTTSEAQPRAGRNSRPARLRPVLIAILGLALVGAAVWLRLHSPFQEAAFQNKSLPELETAARLEPNQFLPQYYLAKQYYLSSRFTEARDAYYQAVRLEPQSARAHLGLALTLYKLQDIEDARQEFQETIRLDDRSAWAHYMLGLFEWSSGRVSAALPHVRRATELDPRSDPAWYGLAVCYTQMRRYQEAINAMRMAVERRPNSAQYHTALGQLLVHRGEVEEGRREFEISLQLHPDYGEACASLGAYYLEKSQEPGALGKAQELLRKAAHLPTSSPAEVYFHLGQVLMRKGEALRAVEALRESVRRDAGDQRAYYALAEAYRRLGDEPAAAAADARFERISNLRVRQQELEARISHVSSDAVSRLELARVYRQLGLGRSALEQYAACLRLNPNSPQAQTEYDDTLKQLGPALQSDFVFSNPQGK